MSNRILTVDDRAKARRLKTLYTQRKDALGLTQVKIAKALKVSQPTVAQYLNAIIPLNTAIILRFADILGVHPVEIDPELKHLRSLSQFEDSTPKRISIPLLGTLSNEGVIGSTDVILREIPKCNLAGILVDDNSLSPINVQKGATILLDLDAYPFAPARHSVLRVKYDHQYHLFTFIGKTTSGYHFTDPLTGKKSSLKEPQILAAHLVLTITPPL